MLRIEYSCAKCLWAQFTLTLISGRLRETTMSLTSILIFIFIIFEDMHHMIWHMLPFEAFHAHSIQVLFEH